MARRRKDKKEENATLKAFKKASDSAKITDKNKKMESKQPKDDFDLKKLGSNKASTKELLGKLSINKKPAKKESVTSLSPKEKADIKAAISLKAKTKKPTKISEPTTKTKVKASVTSNMGAGAGSSQKSNATLKSSNASILKEKDKLVDTNKKNWRDLMQEIRDRH